MVCPVRYQLEILNGTENFDVMSKAEDADVGYFLEVDMEMPESLHEKFKYYPLAPESMTITEDMLSPHCKDMLESFGMKTGGTKLIQNLLPKNNYVIHYVALKR